MLQRAEESFPVLMRTGGASFKDVLDTCAIDQAPGVPTGWGTTNLAKWLMWEDPLLSHLSPQVSDRDMIKHYRQLASALDRRIGAAMRGGGGGEKTKVQGRGDRASTAEEARQAHPLAFPAALAKVLTRKMAFRRDLHDAYIAKNRVAMARLIGHDLGDYGAHKARRWQSKFNGKAMWGQPDGASWDGSEYEPRISNTTIAALRDTDAADGIADKVTNSDVDGGGGGELGALLTALVKTQQLHRGLWRAHYKPHGWELIDSRYGTLRARLEGVGDLIQALLEGRIAVIEELERLPGSPAQPPRVYNAEIYQLPLMCWARAVTPAMPSVKPDNACSL